MSYSIGATLMQSTTRTGLLELLFVRGVTGSVRELARRARVSPRAMGAEVRHLTSTGLVHVTSLGGSDLVHANTDHPSASHLVALLRAPAEPPARQFELRKTREALAAWGAPLAGTRARRHGSLEETLLRGLEAARLDGTVLRVLPTVLAKNLGPVDWDALREDARRRKLKAELGWLVELTAELLGRPELAAHADGLRDRRRRAMRYLPGVKSDYEGQLARLRSDELAKRWGFWMNMSADTFRATLEKHGA